MLAPNPSQHLESETQPLGNPLQRFGLIESCSRPAHMELGRRPGNGALGHEDQFPPSRSNARCAIGKETFGGTRGNGCDAPNADIKRGYAPHQIMNLRLTRTHYGIHEPAVIAKRRSASD